MSAAALRESITRAEPRIEQYSWRAWVITTADSRLFFLAYSERDEEYILTERIATGKSWPMTQDTEIGRFSEPEQAFDWIEGGGDE